MWLWDKYEAWCRSQYDLWGSKLQEKYDFWDSYDNPELREKCQKIWNALSPELQKKIYDFVVAILKKYGPAFAKQIIQKLSELFTSVVDDKDL